MEAIDTDLAEIGVASQALSGETVSGDTYAVAPSAHGLLVAVIDGLGHGSEAAIACDAAAESIMACAGQTVVSIVRQCHERLRGTRGAVMSVASFNAVDSTMTWLAVGNVEACLLRADPATREKPYVLMRAGVVGQNLPPLRAEIMSVSPGDVLVMATDGIQSGFASSIDIRMPPQEIADALMARFAKKTDDALVMVLRWRGESS